MNRVVRGSSLLIVTAIVAACAAQRDEGKATADQQGPPQPQQPATEEADASLAKAEAHDRAIQEIVVTGAKSARGRDQYAPLSVSSVSSPAAVANYSYAPPVYQQPTNTERYEHKDDNPVHLVKEQPVSTFSIDVDTGAYANVRRFLNGGQLPPQDAVRVEEMINYFDYRYAPPASRDVPFRVATEVAPAPWNSQALLMKIGIKGFEVAASQRPPANLVFLIDVSGSMQSPDKLPLLKNAFRLLTDQMTARDRVSMVVYAGSSGVVLSPTPGDQKHKIREAIDRLEAGGSTNGAEGIERAYQLAHSAQIKGGINRVVLATDGDFNVGVVNFEALVDMAERQRASGVAITTLGFGTGNYNDQLLERLADAGNGNYAYVDTLAEARRVLVERLRKTLVTVARDAKVQVEFNPARVAAYRLIGHENRLLAAQDFADDRKDAGDVGAGHSVTALYEIVPVGASTPIRGVDSLRYQQVQPRPGATASPELMTVKLRYKAPDGDRSWLIEQPVRDRGLELARTSDDFRFSAAVAQWGMLLRDSQFKGSSTWSGAAELAGGALGHDEHGYRAEFVRLLGDARRLADRQRPAEGQTTRGEH